jgi:hypothetical protein
MNVVLIVGERPDFGKTNTTGKSRYNNVTELTNVIWWLKMD